MGKVFQNEICSVCGTRGKVIETWGKFYCRACWDAKPKRPGKGHGGMVFTPDLEMPHRDTWDNDLELEAVPKGHKVYANLFLTHYPQSKGVVGRQCHYIVWLRGEVAGIVGANSPPINYKKFSAYFEGYTEDNWMNNNVFNLVLHEKNLGTKVLKLFRQTVKQDYERKYNFPLVGLVTFVEPPRDGALYKADNWDYLGLTQGVTCRRSGDHAKWLNKEWGKGTQKHIFARRLDKSGKM